MKTTGPWATLLAAVLLTLPMAATAQVAVGVSAGPTFATVTGDDIDDDAIDSRTGFFVGGSLGIPLTSMLSFGTGAYYVQKGAEDNSPGEEVSVELDYIEIPAVLQVQVTGPDRPVGISLMAGPSFGFNVGCNVSGSAGGVTVDADCEAVEDFFEAKSFEFGLLFGAGVSFPTSETMSFFVDGGLDLGLTSIADSESEDDPDIKNEVWFFGAGVSWIVGG